AITITQRSVLREQQAHHGQTLRQLASGLETLFDRSYFVGGTLGRLNIIPESARHTALRRISDAKREFRDHEAIDGREIAVHAGFGELLLTETERLGELRIDVARGRQLHRLTLRDLAEGRGVSRGDAPTTGASRPEVHDVERTAEVAPIRGLLLAPD